MEFVSVNVTRNQAALKAMADLSKNAFGCAPMLSTPTTLVGTKVIHGGRLQDILTARGKQSDWKPAR